MFFSSAEVGKQEMKLSNRSEPWRKRRDDFSRLDLLPRKTYPINERR